MHNFTTSITSLTDKKRGLPKPFYDLKNPLNKAFY